MKYIVNENCVGCGMCEGICPEIFSLNEKGLAEAKKGEVPDELLDSAAEAAESCPVQAIEEE